MYVHKEKIKIGGNVSRQHSYTHKSDRMTIFHRMEMNKERSQSAPFTRQSFIKLNRGKIVLSSFMIRIHFMQKYIIKSHSLFPLLPPPFP